MAGARRQGDRAAARSTLAGDAVAEAVLTVVRTRLLRARGGAGNGVVRATGPVPAAVRTPTWLELRVCAEAATQEVALGRADRALQLLAAAGPSELPCVAVAVASAEFAQGRLEAARSSLSPVLELTGLPLDVQTSAWLLQASVELESGEPVPARASLDRALRLAEPERLRRPLMEAPPRLRGFLRRNSQLAAAHPWLLVAGQRSGRPPVHARAQALPAGAPTAAPVVLLPLTEKEKEVLSHLSALLSTEEIAQAMFVSVNTVKTHVRAILRKLEVSGRNEAIRRARDLQLI